jgi:hypothetical protein
MRFVNTYIYVLFLYAIATEATIPYGQILNVEQLIPMGKVLICFGTVSDNLRSVYDI